MIINIFLWKPRLFLVISFLMSTEQLKYLHSGAEQDCTEIKVCEGNNSFCLANIKIRKLTKGCTSFRSCENHIEKAYQKEEVAFNTKLKDF